MSVETLDELKLAWKEMSEKLERQNALTVQQFRENKVARFRSELRPLVAGQITQIILGGIVAGFSAQFWLRLLDAPTLLGCGIFLHLYGLMLVAFAGRDLVMIRRIDYTAPVVVIQKRLAALRAWHIRAAEWYGLTGSIVWLPAMLLALHALGADVWINARQTLPWLLGTGAVCVAVNFGLVWLARSPGKCGRALRASWIGRSVNRAQSMLDEVERFERDLS